jgi:hypothetical protein
MAEEFSTQRLRDAIARATAEIKAKVLQRQDQAASSLFSVLQSRYPRKTGALLRGVRKQKARTSGFIVRSTAPHVHFIERGTRNRFDNTRKNARRGRVKATPIFVPAAVAERRSYLRDLQTILDVRRELV